MFFQPRRERRALILSLFSFALLAVSAHAAEKMRLHVDDYQIDAELAPHSHKLTAKAKVKFTALDDLNFLSAPCRSWRSAVSWLGGLARR